MDGWKENGRINGRKLALVDGRLDGQVYHKSGLKKRRTDVCLGEFKRTDNREMKLTGN